MTFKDRYDIELTWHGKALVMEIYHLAMCQRAKDWTLKATSEYFKCSIGLVSENLRLATAIHINDNLISCNTRQEALRKLNLYKGYTNGKSMETN